MTDETKPGVTLVVLFDCGRMQDAEKVRKLVEPYVLNTRISTDVNSKQYVTRHRRLKLIQERIGYLNASRGRDVSTEEVFRSLRRNNEVTTSRRYFSKDLAMLVFQGKISCTTTLGESGRGRRNLWRIV